MKKLKLKETQFKVIVEKIMITEAMMDGFSLNELNNLTSFNARLKYCKEMLGKPIGKGSSRIVFQIDDNKVLKLAYNNKGIAQNDVEFDWFAQNYDVLPKIFEASDDNRFIISEYVLPAKLRDFEICLDITFDEFCMFAEYTYNTYRNNTKQNFRLGGMTAERYNYLLENNEWLSDFASYQGDFNLPLGDLKAIHNYGLTYRNGKSIIVLLDSGLSEEVWNNYYN